MSAIVTSLQRRLASSWRAASKRVLRSSSRAATAYGVRSSATGTIPSGEAAPGGCAELTWGMIALALLLGCRLEIDLVAHPAVRAGPVVGDLAPRGARGEALAGMAALLVVEVAATRTAPAAHARAP